VPRLKVARFSGLARGTRPICRRRGCDANLDSEPELNAPARLGLAGLTFFLLGGAPAAIAAILLTGIPSLLAALLGCRSGPPVGAARAGAFAQVAGRAREPRFLDL
jgi:hypothetical protein